jgi:hypothetical protein
MAQSIDAIYQDKFVKLKICIGIIFFYLGEECQNQLATISICANVYVYLILLQHCPMSMVATNDTNKHYQLQLFNAQNTVKC